MKNKAVIVALMALMFSGLCILETNAINERPKEPANRVSSVYMLAGEFRTVFANLLWIKAESYHHEFIQRNSNWTKDKELLGLINLITTLDPHFIEAYSSGAVIYINGEHKPKKAVDYLREGITNNPKSWELHQLLAIVYVRQLDDPDRALSHQKLAVKYCNDDFYKKAAIRTLNVIRRDQKEKAAKVVKK